jgi:hypothetical protein
MTSSEKKALLLLKSVIFMYHGLDESEQAILVETAAELDAQEELNWVKRLEYLKKVWADNMKKGYISEMEAMGMLKLAKDWEIERDLIQAIKK